MDLKLILLFVDTDLALFDANGDGALDVYIASGGYHNLSENDPLLQDRLYLNDGTGQFDLTTNYLPDLFINTSKVLPFDFDEDGDQDLLVTGYVKPGNYPEHSPSAILINDGKGKFTNKTKEIAPDLEKLGMITDAAWIDLNDDNKKDLIVVGTWLPISAFIAQGQTLVNQTTTYFDENYKGWWNTIEVVDLNQDGQEDLLVGNYGLNAQFSPNHQEPLELVYGDFDQNGSIDPILSYYVQGKSYPDVTRDELLTQLVHLKSTFTTFDSYADATLSDILDSKALRSAQKLEANFLHSAVFLQTLNRSFELTTLPVEVQFSPVHTINTLDFNQDGILDVLLCGNDRFVKLRTGKLDANYGTLLKGKGDGTFEYINQRNSGLKLQGDIRSVLQFGNSFYFGRTGQSLLAYQLNQSVQ